MGKHARERSQERYNIELTKTDEKCIKELISNGESKFLYKSEKDDNMIFCYVVYKNIPFKILYEKRAKTGVKNIITVYPFDVDEYNKLLETEHEEKLKQFYSRIEKAKVFLQKNGYIVYKRKGKNE